MTPEEALGQVVREERERQGLTQERLALDSGYSRNYVQLLEQGSSSASIGTVFRLARRLGIEPSELVRRAESRVTTVPPRRAEAGA